MLNKPRKPKDQDAAIEKAFIDGTLPAVDRRAPEPTTAVEAPDTPPTNPTDPLHEETRRLIAIAEHETGYVLRAALTKLRALWF